MAYIYNLPNATSGVDDLIVQTTTAMPGFLPMILTFIWLFVFVGGYTAQKRKEASGDPAMWAVLASVATTMITLIFTTKQGMVNLSTLTIVLGITILTAFWYFLSKGRYDQV